MTVPDRRTLTCAALVALGAAVAADAGRKDAPPAPVEPVVRGHTPGPFAAALGPDDRTHVLLTRQEPDGAAQLLHAVERGQQRYAEPELVLAHAPDQVALAVTAAGPVVAFTSGGAAYLAGRDARGWWSTLIAAGGEASGAVVIAAGGDKVEVVLALHDAAGARLRRVVLTAGRSEPESADFPLPDPGSGPITRLEARLGLDGNTHVAYARRVASGRVRTISGDISEGVTAISYTRLADSLLPPLSFTAVGEVEHLQLVLLEERPALVWSVRAGGLASAWWRLQGVSGFQAPEPLLEDMVELTALGAAALGSSAVVAAAYGASPRPVRARWFDGSFWSEWLAPPGAERAEPTDTTGLAVLLAAGPRARLLVRESRSWDRSRPEAERPQRVVDWTMLPRTRAPQQ